MRDLNDKNTGNSLTADEWNDMPSEIQEIIEQTGQTLSGADLKQLAKGIAQYAAAGDFYLDGGAADAYTLTPLASKQRPVAYTDGMRIRFRPDNTNTGASTVAVDGLAATNIFYNGAAVTAGLLPANIMVTCEYDLTNTRFNLISTENAGIGSTGGAELFTSSGTYTPATGVTSVVVMLIGGGGGGGGGAGSADGSGGLGGLPGKTITFTQAVVPGVGETVTIGAGGVAGTAGPDSTNGGSGGAGGTTTFDATSATGGVGGAGGPTADTGASPTNGNDSPPYGSGGAAGITANPTPTAGSAGVGQGSGGGGGGGNDAAGSGGVGSAGGAGGAGACIVYQA